MNNCFLINDLHVVKQMMELEERRWMLQKRMSFEQYRNLDLSIFAVLLIVFEIIVFKAATKWYPDQLYTVSLVPALVTVLMIRWDYFALIHALLGGLVYSYLAEGTVLQFMCYLGGNLFCIFAVFLMKAVGKNKICENNVLAVLFAAFVSLCMQIGRSAISIFMGFGIGKSLYFITTDVLSGVFAMIIVIITRKLDGVFEDQKLYLLRIQKESQEERGSK